MKFQAERYALPNDESDEKEPLINALSDDPAVRLAKPTVNY